MGDARRGAAFYALEVMAWWRSIGRSDITSSMPWRKCKTMEEESRDDHREVCKKGFDKKLNSFVQSYGSKQLDASCC